MENSGISRYFQLSKRGRTRSPVGRDDKEEVSLFSDYKVAWNIAGDAYSEVYLCMKGSLSFEIEVNEEESW